MCVKNKTFKAIEAFLKQDNANDLSAYIIAQGEVLLQSQRLHEFS